MNEKLNSNKSKDKENKDVVGLPPKHHYIDHRDNYKNKCEDLVKIGYKSAMDQMLKEKEDLKLKEQQNKEMIVKRNEAGKKYEQELLEKLKKAPKQKSERKEWG